MANDYVIRCPVCLAQQVVPKNIAVDRLLNCPGCKRQFEFKNALPDSNNPSSTEEPTLLTSQMNVVNRLGAGFWLSSIILMIIVVVTSRNLAQEMRGPQFIMLFIFLFLILWIGSTLLRWLWRDEIALSFMAFLTYEAVGGFRILDGMAMGMHKFGFLYFAMVLGGIIFFARSDNHKNNSSEFGGIFYK